MKISGPKLEAARIAANVSKQELAVIIGQSYQRAWQLTTEAESSMNPVIVGMVAHRFGVKPEDLAAKECPK